MIELKAWVMRTPHDEDRDSDHIAVTEGETEFYIKSEVDNVIAEKDKEIVELKGQVNGFKNRSNLWHFNAVEEHKKLVQATMVIAKNDAKIKRLEKCEKWMKDHFFCEEIASVKVRHQKYKRCLAIARCCFTKSNYHFVVGRSEGGKTAMTHYRISRLYSKWYNRWLKLAEKFKEAK